jgi:triacylglycerol esterase/lipase EstA (alpha/beta hydrolase family)
MVGRMPRHRVLIATVAALAAVLAGAAPAAAHHLPVVYNGIYGYGQSHPTKSPPGSNDWACKPTAAHPRPVVLVHGTFANRAGSWQAISPQLHNEGYCVFALNYGSYRGSGALGIYGTGDIRRSARKLGRYVDRVLAATGATEVDLVGHSQGGMMPRWYLKFHAGAPEKVGVLAGLSPSNHGTTASGLFILSSFFPGADAFTGALCPACRQQKRGSRFLRRLNAGGDTVAGVSYTVVQTRYDTVVTPYTSAFLSGPNVTNILLQDQCGLDFGDHFSMPYDHIAAADVRNALDPAHPVTPACTPVLPVAGG